MNYGFVRVAAITPKMRVADVEYNAREIVGKIKYCAEKGVQIAVFPELCLCGYTCADLLFQPLLLSACKKAVKRIAEETKDCSVLAFIGMPYISGGKIYNVAAAINAGKILAYVPKTFLPNYAEFYEERHFDSAASLKDLSYDEENGAFFGRDILFRAEGVDNLCVGCEICEDLWAAESPCVSLAKKGATIVVNLSASNEVIGKKEYRTTLIQAQSGKCICGYVYASAGVGESTTDTVFSGHDLIAENGAILAESELFTEESVLISEIDVDKLAFERSKISTFSSEGDKEGKTVGVFFKSQPFSEPLVRRFSQTPFVPQGRAERTERAKLILTMQARGLAARLERAKSKTAVVGISGGLDSTLALLVTARAFDLLKKDKKDIIALTMPGFGTTGRTHTNALKLISCVGATMRDIDVTASVLQHFRDIGHDPAVHDVTYENAQARMRTLLLMDTANREGGLVVGTGDLSELALGWCTYNGDHMSMYAVNSSVPKTLVKYLVAAVGEETGGELKAVLDDILSTEISPELLPPDKAGKITQKTEDLIGPYELHDFFLYYAVRWGFEPKKVLYLAKESFAGVYDEKTIVKWLKNFYKRFFSQQFKRSCMPDGVKIGSVTLSPRADWRMPSDAVADLWLKELEEIG